VQQTLEFGAITGSTGSSLAMSSGLDLPLVVPLVTLLSNQDPNPKSFRFKMMVYQSQ
jgi:hypothetical protein